MKLHLPVRLFKSVLACLAAMASFTVGSGVAWADAQDLSFSGATLTWNTAEDNKAFVDAEDAAASFSEGDNVSFTATSEVSLGEHITAGVVAIESGAVVTIDLGAYTLGAEKMVLSGTLNMGGSFTVDSGDTLEIAAAGAVLDSALVMQEKGWLHLDAAVNLNNNDLTLSGKSGLILTATGDGRVYDLVTGISALKDAAGNAINLDSSNNAIANYFDTTLPGSGFWADATLQMTPDGTLQLVRYTDISLPSGYSTTVTVDAVSDITPYSKSAKDVIFRVDCSNLPNQCLTIDSLRSSLMSSNADSWFFTSMSVDKLSSLCFSNATARLFNVEISENLTFSQLNSLAFSNNTYSSSGGVIIGSTDSIITLSNNGSVTFSGNTAVHGGAISADSGTVTLSDNGDVTFSGNTASGSGGFGGAIYAGSVTLSGNGAVTFSGNTAVYGGAIYAGYNGTVTLSDNGDVTFSGNTAASSGGAIYAGYNGTVTLSDNGDVTFSGNTAASSGGAISADSGTVTLSDNGDVTFSGNTASGSGGFGGAIYAGSVTLSDNGDVTFSGNTASGSGGFGGAIYAGSVTLSGNGAVTFSGNTASGSYAYGGAISANEVTLSGNGNVTFSGNTASGSYTDGGAICAYGGIVTLSDNGAVTFSGNTADYGGAIYAEGGTVTLSGNGDVTFIGNTASSTDYSAYGGAIDAYGGIVTLSGNGDVLFEKNTEVEKGIYRLRSIYTMNLNLSASADKKIEFRDSIYASGRVKLNEGGSGNIIFTGATTEADLLSIKGSAGTDDEISASRLSMLRVVELFGGSLMVQHQAQLQSDVFMVNKDADATLVLDDGQFDAGIFIFDSGNTLSLKGKNTLSTGYGKIAGTMQFAVESTHAENALVSYSGFVDLSESSFDIQSTQTTASYQLLSLQERSVVKWNDDLVFTASGIDSSRLVWKDGVLYWDISGNVTESKQVLGDYIFSTDWTLQHVTDKNQISGAGNLAFCLDSDVEWDGLASSLINNYSSLVFITGEQSADGKPLYSFDFDNATSTAFKVASLMVADLKEVTFSGNTASGSYADGGAIDATTVTLSGNGAVTFSGNTASGSYAYGRAIDATTVTLSGNGDVTFSGNTASGSSYAYGGAIYANVGTVTLSGNGDVTFSGNSASGSSAAYGGAIYATGGTVTLSGNGNVSFSGNTASSTDSSAYGGAIDANSGTVTLSGNGAVTFSGNTASGGSYADGGAIRANSGTVTLSGNGAVTFSGNTASSTDSSACGGAIYATGGTVTLSGNGAVTFSGNTASSTDSSACGGAIDARGGTVTLSGNGDVTFERNAEVENGTYRLRSIDTGNLNLSASDGKKIEFCDSIYASGTVNLNADYTDAEGVTHKQTGDIIFTGATTEADLLAVKGSAGTSSEIINSRTSIVKMETHLYGGRLRIEDGAVFQGAGLTVAEGANATVALKDATMTHTGKAVSFASGTTLAAAGKSALTVGRLTMADGAAWSFEVSSANADKAVLTYSGALTLSGKLSVNLTRNGALPEGVSYQLLTGVAKPTNWTADNITVSSATTGWSVDFADLTWVDNTLWLYYDTRPDLTIATWTNESNDGLWNTSSVNWEQDEYDYAYKDAVQVVFGNKGAGTVTLVGDLAPESVLVNSSQNYSFEGAGKLTGSMKLTKQGEGTLTINTANDYTGGTLISGGKLVAGNATALGSGAVELAGGTLEIGVTGFANAISNIGTSTLKIADGITHQLNATLTNSGTLTLIGAVDASALATDIAETHVDAEGNSGNSGFLRLAGKEVDIMVGSGALVNNGSVTINGTTVTLDAGGYGKLEGAVQYGKYSIVDGTHSVDAILGKSATASIEMSAGTLTANAATDKLTATGGVINLNKNVELGGSISNAVINVSDGTLSATLSGNNTLNAANWALGTALTNNGTLTLTGTVDAYALATVIAETHIDAEGNSGHSGFLRLAGKEVDIMDGSGTLVNNGTVTIDGTTVTLDAGGYGRLEGAVQYGLYSIVDGTHSVESILGKSATATIEMSAGTLTANAATDKLTATGGVINLNKNVELGGSISNAVINVSDGTLSATLTGANTLNAANWALGTALTNNGTLTLTGTVDASDLAVHVDEMLVNTQLQPSTSGFLKTAGSSVDIMDGSGTLDSTGATITVNGQTITLDEQGRGQLGQTINYGLYTINDTDSASVKEIMKAAKGEAETTDIVMNGGSLSFDADATGSLSLTGTASATVDVASTLFGNLVLNGGTLAMQGELLTIGGALDIQGATFLSLDGYVTEGTYTLLTYGSFTGNLSQLQLQNLTSSTLKMTLLTSDDALMLVLGNKIDWSGGDITGGVLEDMDITISDDRNVSADIIGDSSVTVNGGDVTLSGNNSYTGGTEINGGSLTAGSDTAFGTGDVTLNDGKLDLNDMDITNDIIANGGTLDGATNYGGDLTVNGDLVVGDNTTANSITVNKGDITGGSLTNTGITYMGDSNTSADITGDSSVEVEDGDVTLSGNNSYTGGTEVNGGSLTAGSDTAFGTGDVTLNDGKLDLNGMGVGNDILANGGTLDGATNYGGDLTVNGDLEVGDNTTANSITVNKGDITGGSLTNTEITYKGDSNTSADITGDSSVEVEDGDVTLSGNNSYTGGTEVNGGSLTAGSDTAFGTGDVTLNDGKLDLNGMGVGNDILANGGTLDGATNYGGDLSVNGDLVVGDNTTANSITVTQGDITGGSLTNTDITYKGDSNTSADITGDSSVTVNGGDVTLSGNNSYTGDTEINGGSLTAGSDMAFGTGDVMLNDGSLDLNGAGVGNDIIAVGGTLDGATNYGGDLTVNGDLVVGDNTTANSITVTQGDITGGSLTNTDITYKGDSNTSADITGDSSVVVNGCDVTLSGNNSYTGGTELVNGSLTVMHPNALGAGALTSSGDSSLTVGNGLTLELDRMITNNGSLTLTGSIDASALAVSPVDGLVDAQLLGSTSGFRKTGDASVDIMNGSGTLDSSGATITVNGQTITLDEHGYGELGQHIDFSKYTINGTDSASVKAIMKAAKGEADTTDIVMNGGSLSIDADATGDVTLNGAAFASVDKNAKVAGDVVLNGGTLSLQADKKLSISGTLYVKGASDLLLSGYGAEGLYKLLSFGSFAGDIALLNPMERMRASSKKTLLTTDDSLMLVTGDKLDWTGGNITSGKLDGLEITYTGDSNTSADITGDSSVTVEDGDVCLSGNNSYTGGTEVNGGSLTAGSDMAFGTGDVTLNDGVLDLNNKQVTNNLAAHGGTIAGGSHYCGSLTLGGHVTLGGNLSAGSATVQDGTKLTLNNHTLNVSGSLTMQGGMTLDLAGSSFGDGDTLITFGSFDGDVEDITLLSANGDYELRVDGNALILELLEALQEPAVIDREACDTLVQANWGAFSASHAFTDAVHGQRTAAGYVAGGNATVWMSALGGQHTLDSSKGCAGANVELYGGAVGIEGQLDADNRIGFALGHVRGEVKPEHGNFAKVDQDGTYAALYGAHTLVDEVYSHWVTLNWSMAYGDTESEVKTGGSKTSWNQDSIQLNARLDWVQAVTLNTSVSAFAGLEYYANNSDELAEGTKTGSVQNLRGEIGVGVRHTMGSTAVYAELSYLNDMLRHNPTATVDGLRGQGANPGRHGIGISAGLQQNLGDGWSVNLNYSMEAMQHADEHRANIGIGKRF